MSYGPGPVPVPYYPQPPVYPQPIPTPVPVPIPYSQPSGAYSSVPVVTSYCGDAIVQLNERCDAGDRNGQPGEDCSTTCQVLIGAACGNAVIDDGEECDDGNARNADGCTAQCKTENGVCGDGAVQGAYGEECDAGEMNGTAESDCDSQCRWLRLPQCGDGIVDPVSEQCDLAERNGDYESTLCLSNCIFPYCSDGITEVNEECDDGNLFDGDGCDAVCRVERGASPIAGDLIPSRPRTPVETYDYSKIPTPARTPTGPGLVIFLATGAAAGFAFVRRRIV